ncbi:MAG: hypothetical protein U0166_08570 [Acidobacteriota bacterium]
MKAMVWPSGEKRANACSAGWVVRRLAGVLPETGAIQRSPSAEKTMRSPWMSGYLR